MAELTLAEEPTESLPEILDPMRPKRLKILMVDPQLIVEVLNWCNNPGDALMGLPVFDELPKGTRIIDMTSDWSTGLLMFKIEHESFPKVHPGCHIERVGNAIGWRAFRQENGLAKEGFAE